MADTTETFQISLEAAEQYELNFVPVLFAEWGQLLADAAMVAPGQRILDVACGTGAVSRAVVERVGTSSSVVGVDLNENMLVVARRLLPDVEWRRGDAMSLPFEPATFDAVLCASGLMFFPDLVRGLREMARVVRPAGRVAVQSWAQRKDQEGYGPMFDVVARHAGPDAVDLVSTYFRLGGIDVLTDQLQEAGLQVTSTATHRTTIRLPSVEALVRTEVESTPLRERITDDVYEAIIRDSTRALQRFCTDKGSLHLPIEGHILVARRA